MSETSSKKNSIVDKILLGVAGALAIGMLAAGPRGEAKQVVEEEEVAQNENAEKPGEKEPGKANQKARSGNAKKIAAIQTELEKARRANADLKAQLRKSEIALEMKEGDKEDPGKSTEELEKAKADLEAKLKAAKEAAQAVEEARKEKARLIKDLENLLKEAK